jgi:hypothetical protein
MIAAALARDLNISLAYAKRLMADLNAGRLDEEPWLHHLVVEALCGQWNAAWESGRYIRSRRVGRVYYDEMSDGHFVHDGEVEG